MRITISLIEHSISFLSPTNQRELDMRDNEIKNIESLEFTYDQYEALDLTNNTISIIDNLSFLPNLKSLYLSNNKIHSITQDISHKLPNLESIILSHNLISSISSLIPLFKLKYLQRITLLGNPITEYRTFLIKNMPQLSVIDSTKITKLERKAASVAIIQPQDNIKEENPRKRIKIEIEEATTLEELEKLENLLNKSVSTD